ncbi:MAG TPA: hypothetical protein V6D11_04210 [Waterburya sp.]
MQRQAVCLCHLPEIQGWEISAMASHPIQLQNLLDKQQERGDAKMGRQRDREEPHKRESKKRIW